MALAKSTIEQAEDAATRLPAGHPERRGLRLLTGRLALQIADHSAARSAFEEVVAQAPEQGIGVMARLGLADLALLLGDAESALASAEIAKAQAMRLQGGKPVSYRRAWRASREREHSPPPDARLKPGPKPRQPRRCSSQSTPTIRRWSKRARSRLANRPIVQPPLSVNPHARVPFNRAHCCYTT